MMTIDERRTSLLDMARDGIGDPIAPRVAVVGRESDLLGALFTGKGLADRLGAIDARNADMVVRGVHDARCLRLYHADLGGHLRGINTLVGAETAVGIRDEDGNVKEAWR